MPILLPPSLTQLTGQLAAISAGIIVLAKALDFLLYDKQKMWLKKLFEDMWLWSAANEERLQARLRAPDTPEAASSQKKQLANMKFLIAFTHIAVALLIFADDGLPRSSRVVLGFPRAFGWQWIIDISALAVSAFVAWPLVFAYVLPWIASGGSLPSRAWRCLIILISVFGALILVPIVEAVAIPYLPVVSGAPRSYFVSSGFGVGSDRFLTNLWEWTGSHSISTRSFIDLQIIYGLTAILIAPLVIAEIVIVGVFFSVIFILGVGIGLRGLSVIGRFLIFKIATYPSGPLIAITTMLAGVAWVLDRLPK